MNEDLSTQHGFVSNLFSLPGAKEDQSRLRLTDEQVEFYREFGYVSGIRVLNDEQVDALRLELAEVMDPLHSGHHFFHEFHSNESIDPSKTLFHALGAWRIKVGLHDLLWNPAFTIPASQLLGGSVRFWHDQLFCKPAHHGGVVAWHQDYSYWTRTKPIAHLSCWIGLDDATVENGCLHYVPRSHRWNLLPVTGLAGDMNAIQTVLSESQNTEFNPVAIELKAGEAAFHHPLLVHGSFENKSPRPRRGLVINVVRDGVESDSNEPLLDGVPVVPKGNRLDGQFFPLLHVPAVIF
jgi:ectoine hydroxylase-related dioxygenase (phytanoyl-CoA dioxygenase family)